jgi:hypothetical protein
MSKSEQDIPKKIECIKLLNKMKIVTSEVDIRGHHLFFKYEEIYIVCKIGNNILFDFIEFEKEEIAKEYFLKQRINTTQRLTTNSL